MKPSISIFNDVIGPIMRGPSSSHTAAGWRVANVAMQLLKGELSSALIVFDKDGQWATNYREQGTVLGMNGGLLNINMADDQMKRTEEIATERGIRIQYSIGSFENSHPNSMLLTLNSKTGKTIEVLAASLGGGSIEIQRINGSRVSFKGDKYVAFISATSNEEGNIRKSLDSEFSIHVESVNDTYVHIIESPLPIQHTLEALLENDSAVLFSTFANPILPIISGFEKELPFSTVSSLLEYAETTGVSLGEIGLIYEHYRSGLSKEILLQKMEELIDIMEASIKKGLAGTDFKDRILHQQSHKVGQAEKAGKILQGSIVNTIVSYTAAIMESKSALEVVVANPTAGSCATVCAAMTAVAEELVVSKKDKIMAYYATGLVGAYFAMGPGFSAEEHGCQVETGASAGMAAAGIVELFGGDASQALGAASMAIQNTIGLVCDPIADRVEAPCLGKNTNAAVNALSSATMASSGFAHLIPLDQVLETVSRVSALMPACHKCTGTGGLAVTEAALGIKEGLGPVF
jgi:L-serine dehydratase